MGRREDEHLPVVQAHIKSRLERVISRVPQYSSGGPTHDLETSDGNGPSIAIEVKELVPREFLATSAQVTRDRGFNSEILAKRWWILVEEDPLSTRLAPMPRFPDDPPQDHVASLAMSGLILIPKTKREDEWRLQHTLAPRAQLRIRNLAKDIEPHLAVLERFRITETRAYSLPTSSLAEFQTAQEAIWAIKRRTRDSICMAHEPFDGERPGIDLHFTYGSVRTAKPDVVAERVQMWLDSEQSTNLIESLIRSGADERHAALWLSTEAESESAREQGREFCPATSMQLPAGIDVLWLFVGPAALCYDGGWTVSELARF